MHTLTHHLRRHRIWLATTLAIPTLIAFWSCSSASHRTPADAIDESVERVIAAIRSEVTDSERSNRACLVATEFQLREQRFLAAAAELTASFHELNRNPDVTRAALESEMNRLVTLRRAFRDDMVWFYSSLRTELGPDDWTSVLDQLKSEELAWKELAL